jgi:hypothetical protein
MGVLWWGRGGELEKDCCHCALNVITGLVPVIPIDRSASLFQSRWLAQGQP